MNARASLRWMLVLAGCLGVTAGLQRLHAADKGATAGNVQPGLLEYTVQLDTVMSGFDGKTCWVAPRAGVVPGAKPSVVMVMQKLLLTGSDVFFAINEVRSDDLGKTWSPPLEHSTTLGRRNEPNGVEVVVGDFVPKWHALTGKLLGTGPTIRYQKNAAGAEVKISQNEASSRTAYAVYDPQQRTWTPWERIVMPDDPKFFYATVGASQRVDLPNGQILLPFHFKTAGESPYHTAVMRCSFDGRTLAYIDHGDELERPAEPGVEYKLPGGRQTGVFEPSLVRYRGRYFLTMRNDRAAYVATSTDGLHFGPVRRWRFDDGGDLGSTNTQQHWVAHSDGLLLVYTRKGANNGHVFRSRAPLFIAQVDPEKLHVIRSTERVLIPERGAGLGNAFGVTEINANETWVTTAEWMQGPKGILFPGNQYGSDNSVYAARIIWKTPNQDLDAMRPTTSSSVTRLPRDNLLVYSGPNNEALPVRTTDDWLKRRAEIMRGVQRVMGTLPGAEKRCPLQIQVEEEVDCGKYLRRLITYASEPAGRVPAYLCIPKSALQSDAKPVPAVLCLHGTNKTVGHGSVVGLGDKPNRNYAAELAERGYVTLAPSYPLLANYQPDLAALGWESGTLKAVWDNMRGLDLLDTLPFVKSGGYGVMGQSLGGHNSVFTAVFDERIKAVVSSCGLDSFLDHYNGDDKLWLPGRAWAQPLYMPRMADYRNRLTEIPFDFHELVGALAPRDVLIVAPLKDHNFRADSVDRIAAAALQIYNLYGQPGRLRVEHPDCEHDFPPAMRELAYRLFDAVLR